MLCIDLYAEIKCPWCFIGLHRLDKVLQAHFSDIPVDIRHGPIVLLPDAPATGLYISDLLHSRCGVIDPKTAFARPEAEARASGFALDLSRQRCTYPTQAAHALLLAAGVKGTQHSLAIALTDAYFLDARNIGDIDVLADVADQHGFDRFEARAVALDPPAHKQVEEASLYLQLQASGLCRTSNSVLKSPSAAAVAKSRWHRAFAKPYAATARCRAPPLQLLEPCQRCDRNLSLDTRCGNSTWAEELSCFLHCHQFLRTGKTGCLFRGPPRRPTPKRTVEEVSV